MSRRKRQASKAVKKTIYILVLCVLVVFFLSPIFVMVTKSFMTANETREAGRFFAEKPMFENFKVILDIKYLQMLKNTLLIVIVNITVGPLVAAFGAYGFARLKFIGQKILFTFIISTLMLPALITQIPSYIMYAKLGLLNSLAPFMLPAVFGGGVLSVFLTMQFMRTIPKEIDEAAYIDGANKFVIFSVVILPLCSPILIYLAVTSFSACWNDIQGPLIYLSGVQDAGKYTLNLGLFYDSSSGGKLNLYKNLQMALGVIMTIPPALVFLFFQNRLVDGVTMSGIKG